MKLYGAYPHAWGRVKNLDQPPAEYACSVERTDGHETKGDLAVKWAVRFGFVFVLALLVLERLA